MTRFLLVPPEYIATTDENVMRDYVSNMRDLFRAALDPDNLHTNWLITDIARATQASTYVGFYFVVRHMSSGTATGPEFLIINLWHATSDGFFGGIMQNTTESAKFFYRVGDNAADTNQSVHSQFAMHLSIDSGAVEANSYDFGFDDFSEGGYDSTLDTVTGSGAGTFIAGEVLTGGTSGAKAIFVSEGSDSGGTTPLTVHYINGTFEDGENISSASANRTTQTPVNVVKGDFSAPATNPGSNLVGFMPTNAQTTHPYGAYFPDATRALERYTVFVVDETEPFLACYFTYGLELRFANLCVAGKIVSPLEAGDTYTEGIFTHRLFYDDTHVNSTRGSGSSTIFFSGRYGFHGGGGGRAIFTVRWDTPFTVDSFRRATDGKTPWVKISLSDSNEYKGFINPDIMKVMGITDEHHSATFDHETDPLIVYIKLSEAICFPWVPAAQAIPPYPWNLKSSFVDGGV